MRPTFLIKFHEGRWRINVDGDWFGSFPTQAAAEAASIELAHATSELAPTVIVREKNGAERVVFDQIKLIDELSEELSSYIHDTSTGTCSLQVLREEVGRRVLKCAKYQLSNDDVVDVILASFGVHRAHTYH